MAISFCEGEEKAFLKDILKLIARDIPVVTEHPFHNGDSMSAPAQRPLAQKPKQQHPRDKKGGFSRNRPGHVAPRQQKDKGNGNGQPRHGQQQRSHQQRERSTSK
jgi:ATP-dependent RNA helicase RhlE